MEKRFFLFSSFLFLMLFVPIDISALTVDSYQNRHVCSSFELAGAHTDGTIATVGCYDSYQSAKNAMISSGASDLIILDEGGTTKIVDAQYALVDLTVNTLTYFYETKDLNTRIYTSINTSSIYGGVDAALIEVNPTNYAAKVKIAGFTGWIAKENYAIVPLTWVKSSSNYQVSNDSIRHNYVSNINQTSSIGGSDLGPKPSFLNVGTYYSYDGHYFYTQLETMLKDYKNNTYHQAVNKDNPYYNYYMYLSNHTKTTYSSSNIDEYVRNVLGYTKNVYGDTAKSGASRLYGEGAYFYYAQQKYGINALLSFSLSRNETGNGRSSLAINNNNGFGLNAVDSSPTESAYYYASFSSSILGYASKWNQYGYSYATDWRYFGPAFGDKFNGMNVKYATDAYWSEKMASNYYNFDKYYGLNDYNYYQLGIVTGPTNAYFSANTSKKIYEYPEYGDQLVIVGQSGDYYKVMSDMNIDSSGNLVGSKTDYQDYRWNSSYVYVKKADVELINQGKNGYIDPSSVTTYQDSNYSYDLLIEDTVLKPQVAVTTKEVSYYYDSALTSKMELKLLKDKYVMVYGIARDKSGNIVSYLVTSDYFYDQKNWVAADSIRFVSSNYGKQTVTISGAYEWVCSQAIDEEKYKISGQYTNSYVPILNSKLVNGVLWYQVPVRLDSNTNSYGWILAREANAYMDVYQSVATNHSPVIQAKDLEVVQGSSVDFMENVTATDTEDGDLTSKIIITSNQVNMDVVGTYSITYSVTDKDNATTTKEVQVSVLENQKPEITATDLEIIEGSKFIPLSGVSAKDKEDGDLTQNIQVEKNAVDTSKVGSYEVIYSVSDSYSQMVTKSIIVTVVKDMEPVIEATDKEVTINQKFSPLDGITSSDKEDGDLTDQVTVIENTVDTKKIGTYQVTYQVKDSYGHIVTKSIMISIVKDQSPIITAENQQITLNSNFDPMKNVTAIDTEDGDLSYKIQVDSNVNVGQAGTYTVKYSVSDSYGNYVEKEITVEVLEKELEEREGNFYFEYLKKVGDSLELKGYMTITGINHTLEDAISYQLILINIDTNQEYYFDATRITDSKEIPKNAYSIDGKDYTYSWFTYDFDFSKVETGDYQMYIVATSPDYYSKSIVNNKLYKTQDSSFVSDKSVVIYNNYNDKNSPVELLVRNEVLAKKQASSYYNQFDKYQEFKFLENNKLYLKGVSYSYGADLSKSVNVSRTIIFENKDTYKTYRYDLDSITTESKKVVLPEDDGLDKTRAWYEKSIDISDIPKGEYVIYITTSSNITDISYFTEKLGRSLAEVSTVIDGKKYSFSINMNKGNRIEMIVS